MSDQIVSLLTDPHKILQKLCDERGLKMFSVARDAGVYQQTLQNWKNSKVAKTDGVAKLLAEILKHQPLAAPPAKKAVQIKNFKENLAVLGFREEMSSWHKGDLTTGRLSYFSDDDSWAVATVDNGKRHEIELKIDTLEQLRTVWNVLTGGEEI